MPKQQQQPIDFKALARQLAVQFGVDPEIVIKLITAESGWNTKAVSKAGAIGLGQLMPKTALGLGVDINDPVSNLTGAVKYFAEQYKRFGNYPMALAAYNAGPSTVNKYKGIPPFKETRNYVGNILNNTPYAVKPSPAGPLAKTNQTVAPQQPSSSFTGGVKTNALPQMALLNMDGTPAQPNQAAPQQQAAPLTLTQPTSMGQFNQGLDNQVQQVTRIPDPNTITLPAVAPVPELPDFDLTKWRATREANLTTNPKVPTFEQGQTPVKWGQNLTKTRALPEGLRGMGDKPISAVDEAGNPIRFANPGEATDFANKNSHTTRNNILRNAAGGAAIGTLGGPIGMALGGVIGAGVGAFKSGRSLGQSGERLFMDQENMKDRLALQETDIGILSNAAKLQGGRQLAAGGAFDYQQLQDGIDRGVDLDQMGFATQVALEGGRDTLNNRIQSLQDQANLLQQLSVKQTLDFGQIAQLEAINTELGQFGAGPPSLVDVQRQQNLLEQQAITNATGNQVAAVQAITPGQAAYNAEVTGQTNNTRDNYTSRANTDTNARTSIATAMITTDGAVSIASLQNAADVKIAEYQQETALYGPKYAHERERQLEEATQTMMALADQLDVVALAQDPTTQYVAARMGMTPKQVAEAYKNDKSAFNDLMRTMMGKMTPAAFMGRNPGFTGAGIGAGIGAGAGAGAAILATGAFPAVLGPLSGVTIPSATVLGAGLGAKIGGVFGKAAAATTPTTPMRNPLAPSGLVTGAGQR